MKNIRLFPLSLFYVSFKLKVDFAVILTGFGQVLLEAENITWHTIKILDTSIKYILKQWKALKACPDWLLRTRISFAIYLRATCAGFVPKNIIVAGINELKKFFLCGTMVSEDICLAAARLGKHLATSTSVNSC